MCRKKSWYMETGNGSSKFTPEKTTPCVTTAATAALVAIDMDLRIKPPVFLSASSGRFV